MSALFRPEGRATMPRPCDSAEYIAREQPSTADKDRPAANGERDGNKRTHGARKTGICFGYSDGLLHPLAQIGAQATGRRYRRADGQERGTKWSAMVVPASGLGFNRIWRPFHIHRCKDIIGREQATIHLVLILNSFAAVLQSLGDFLRRLLLPLGRNDLIWHGILADSFAFSRLIRQAGTAWVTFRTAETILPGVPT